MYTIHTDVKMTRRKTMCHVTDDQGNPVWSGNKVGAAFRYMAEIGQWTFHLQAEGERLRVMIGLTDS